MNVGSGVSECPAEVHGDTYAAYNWGCRCPGARRAARQYQKLRVVDRDRGRPRLVDATGTRRRLQALMCLGWTFTEVGRRIGVRGEAVRQLTQRPNVWRSTAERVAGIYDELSMQFPPERTLTERQMAARARAFARRQGWKPPLAWDDDEIDDPKARPHLPRTSGLGERLVDEAVVERFIASGERPRTLTHAEAQEAWRRLRRRGVSTFDLEHVYGLRSSRYDEGGAA